MKQSLVLSILLLLLSFVAPILARNKPHEAMSPAASPAPEPSNSDCSTIIYSMMDCLSYLSIPSKDTEPEKSCCKGIESVLQYNPQCVCVGLESSKEMGIPLNNTRALSLPKTCKIAIAAPHCDLTIPGVSTPGSSTPGVSPVSPSARTPSNSPSSPTYLAESPSVTAPAPSSSGTSNLSVPSLIIISVIVSSFAYISAFSN